MWSHGLIQLDEEKALPRGGSLEATMKGDEYTPVFVSGFRLGGFKKGNWGHISERPGPQYRPV